MKIVVLASEAVPFAKTGGLADVMGALPPALERLGHAVSLILPYYPLHWKPGLPWKDTGQTLWIPLGERVVEGRIGASELPGSHVPVYLIDQPDFFDRDGLYQLNGVDYPDNAERFIFFNRAALEAIRLLDLQPDVIHCNEWETGLVPVYLEEMYRTRPGFETIATVFSLHNVAYQGSFGAEKMALTGLDARLFNSQQLEFHGQLCFLKAGMVFADILSTVSPTYAREIQTPEQGRGLDGVLRARSGDLRGIVNGIDTAVWNPGTDRFLVKPYDAATVAEGKAACKAQLQRMAGLPERPDVPLFAQIGRLDPQKGWDLLAAVADDLLRREVQVVILGEGQPKYRDLLDELAAEHPGKLRVFVAFSNPLSHQIEAGADVFLMPSLFEPCGLNQLYSLAYGTVPVVRATGGLADTVTDATPERLADGTATGFVFHEATPEALKEAIGRVLRLWPDRGAWARLVQAGMRCDWSWDRGAREYAALYEEARQRRAARAAG